MTVRNLDALFKLKAIALIGASNRPRHLSPAGRGRIAKRSG
jgi:acyl-CoA synthetase (NDP forming)